MGDVIIPIHGAWGKEAQWADMTAYFVAHEYEVIPVELPGHGNTPTTKPMRLLSLEDYVRAVEEVAFQHPNPVLIGHSTGGLVAQLMLAKYPKRCRAGVLLASVPPFGILRTVARFIRDEPISVINSVARLSPWELVKSEELARRRLFGARVSLPQLQHRKGHLGEESARVLLQMFLPRRIVIPNSVPLLVLGAREDHIFRPSQIEATARYYGVPYQIFDGMPHMMMYGEHASTVAQAIINWLARP